MVVLGYALILTDLGKEGMKNHLNIVNIVVSGEIGIGEIDTDQLAEDIVVPDLTIQPGRLYLKPEDRPTIIIYKSGKFSIAGAGSREQVSSAINWLIDSLQALGIDTPSELIFDNSSIEFMVLQGNIGKDVDLENALKDLPPENTEYEPEQFPAIIYRPSRPDCTVTIFSTGEISITGVTDKESAKQLFEKLKSMLSK